MLSARGLGVSMPAASLHMMVPLVAEGKYQSNELVTGLQLRMLGSTLRKAISTSILDRHLNSALKGGVVGGAAGCCVEIGRGYRVATAGARFR
ncbi:hypothetical protein BDW71DRAFT_184157 [Aspergillus fruticulosus]